MRGVGMLTIGLGLSVVAANAGQFSPTQSAPTQFAPTQSSPIESAPAKSGALQTGAPDSSQSLYLQLSTAGLDPARVFRVRNASLDRAAIHITLEDGTIAFTQDVMGKITGAFFEGDGEILLAPPNDVERKSMSLFTGMAILEERFVTAYFRFNDNTAAELQPGLRAADNAQEFVGRWGETARNLAQRDAMRLLLSFSRMLPVKGEAGLQGTNSPGAGAEGVSDFRSHMLHARLQGNQLGVFDVAFDSAADEQIESGQEKTAGNGNVYYDVWTSFSTDEGAQASSAPAHDLQTVPADTEAPEDPIAVRRYVIDAEVKPPKHLDATVRMDLEVVRGGARTLVFELSRFLQIQSVEEDGIPLEFIHNPAIEGTQLARRGNDMLAVTLPEPVHSGQKISLRFVYGGEVLAEAGEGLLYVGERGTWYPNRGLAMADFDLTFHYPPGWTLVATGKPAPMAASTSGNAAQTVISAQTPAQKGEQEGRWVSERPIPVAGFNLGKYVRAAVHAGNVTVETYATTGVERNFPSVAPQVAAPDPEGLRHHLPEVTIPAAPSPARNAMAVAELTARAISDYMGWFGSFPYSQLALTQMPGRESQGWPGLIFLSSYAFLSKEERQELHMNPDATLRTEQIPAHEAAHQWWGDLITWRSYRDQWFSEGLANYCSLMVLQQKSPQDFRHIMEDYRRGRAEKNKDGSLPKDSGPVTLGARLLSSHYPGGYEAISYGRGTWLFHMLRSMLDDAAAESRAEKNAGRISGEDPFMRSLRRLRERYQGKAITTRELLEVFAEDLPPALRYEGKPSLDWFLDGWVNGTSLPRLELREVKFAAKTNATAVSGTIVQKDAPDDLVTSVPIYGVVAGKAPVLLGRVFADGAESSFHVLAPAGTHKILLDPYETVLTGRK